VIAETHVFQGILVHVLLFCLGTKQVWLLRRLKILEAGKKTEFCWHFLVVQIQLRGGRGALALARSAIHFQPVRFNFPGARKSIGLARQSQLEVSLISKARARQFRSVFFFGVGDRYDD
jgi:hypothetical protein